MDIIETTNSGLEQRIHIFENPLTEDGLNTVISMPEDVWLLLERHKGVYRESIYIPDWNEVNWVLAGQMVLYNPKIDMRNLEFLTSSSYHVQAVRKGNAKDVTPLGVDGLIRTSDNKFIYGIRGGKVGRGEASIVPSGALSIPVEKITPSVLRNPIFSIFYKELSDEAAIEKEEIYNVLLIAYLTDPELSKSIQFIFYGETPLNSSEVMKRYKRAYDAYKGALNKDKSNEIEAREVIKTAGLSNIDAWEHENLVFLEPNSIRTIINSRQVYYDKKGYTLSTIGRGALIVLENLDIFN